MEKQIYANMRGERLESVDCYILHQHYEDGNPIYSESDFINPQLEEVLRVEFMR